MSPAPLPRWVVWTGVLPVAAYFALGCIAFPGLFWGSLCALVVAAVMIAGLRLSGPYVERWRRGQHARDEMKLLGKVEKQTEVVLVETGAPYRGARVRVELPPEPTRPTVLQRTQWLLFRQPDPFAERLSLESEAEQMEAELERKMHR